MKKLGILFVLVLGLAAAAWAGEPAASVAAPAVIDPAGFLEQLGAAPGAPRPESRSACYISRECVCGGGYVTIECWGDVSCSYAPRAVVCDDEYTYCPPIGSCPP